MSSQRYISPELRKKKKKIQKIRRYILLAILIIIVTGFVYLLRIPQIQIKDVSIAGNSFVPTQEIQDKANSILNSHIAWFIPLRNIFLFPSATLEAQIKENPAVVDVHVDKDFFHTLSIEIVEQEKEAIYCTGFERTECYYINKDGFIYLKVTEQIDLDQEIIIYIDGEQKNIQHYIFDTELYKQVLGFIKSSARYGIPVAHAHLKQDSILEFYLKDGVTLLNSRYDTLENNFNNFVALFDQNVITKEQLPQIEYIDLRFGNKVFYKNKAN